LLIKLYRLGWYVGTHDLLSITVEGGFEHNLSCRASEDWNLIFVVRTKEIRNADTNKVILKATENKSEILEDALRACLRDLE
jgi:hypothetical protein